MEALEDLDFRPAAPEDFAALKELHARAFAVLAGHLHSARQVEAHTRLTLAPDYEADLALSQLMLAVMRSGEIVASAGWIRVPEETDTGRIRKVFVDPRFARRGLATRLVRDAEARARAAGCTRLIVRANINAVPLYEKLGYRGARPGSMRALDGTELPVVFMEKRQPI